MTRLMVSKTTATVARLWPTATVLAGIVLFAAFAVSGSSDATVVTFALLGFVAGGLRLRLSAGGASDGTEISLGTAVTFAGALACGPLGAVAPAAMVVLGRTFVSTEEPAPVCQWIGKVARAEVRATLVALVFVICGGSTQTPWSLISVPAALAALILWTAAEGFSERRFVPSNATWTALALGYALSGSVRALPEWVVLIPAVPAAFTTLRMIQRAQNIRQEEAVKEEPGTEGPSFVDPVTGAANSRYLEMFLQQEISRSERGGHQVSLLLVDIDNFSEMAAQNSPEGCDKYLAALVHSFKGTLRDYDVVARQKGDQFVIVLPDSGAEVGSNLAVRLHDSFSGQLLPLRATFSIGVATYPLHGSTVDTLLDSAHHALNRAKFSGKNQVRSCHELARAS